LVNARIWTGDGSRPWAEALLAREGRVVVVGSNDDVEQARDAGAEVVDLRGRLALPRREP
jgi:predicted amidohydrolase YtcJ